MKTIINFIVDNFINLGIFTGLLTYIFKVRSDRKVEYLKSTLNSLSDKLPEVMDFFSSDLFDGNFDVEKWKEYYSAILTFGSRRTIYLLSVLMQLLYVDENGKGLMFFLKKEFKFVYLYMKYYYFDDENIYNKQIKKLKFVLQISIVSLIFSSLKKDLFNINIIDASVLKCKLKDYYQLSMLICLISFNLNIKCFLRRFI